MRLLGDKSVIEDKNTMLDLSFAFFFGNITVIPGN